VESHLACNDNPSPLCYITPVIERSDIAPYNKRKRNRLPSQHSVVWGVFALFAVHLPWIFIQESTHQVGGIRCASLGGDLVEELPGEVMRGLVYLQEANHN